MSLDLSNYRFSLSLVAGNRLQIAVVLAASRLGGFAHRHSRIFIGIDALAEMNRILQFLQQYGLK